MNSRRGSGLPTWSEIWCDVENSKSFRSSRDRRIFPGHRLKGASALHNYLASIFTAPSVMAWSDMSGNTRKTQVTRLVTLRHRSTMSGALGLNPVSIDAGITLDLIENNPTLNKLPRFGVVYFDEISAYTTAGARSLTAGDA